MEHIHKRIVATLHQWNNISGMAQDEQGIQYTVHQNHASPPRSFHGKVGDRIEIFANYDAQGSIESYEFQAITRHRRFSPQERWLRRGLLLIGIVAWIIGLPVSNRVLEPLQWLWLWLMIGIIFLRYASHYREMRNTGEPFARGRFIIEQLGLWLLSLFIDHAVYQTIFHLAQLLLVLYFWHLFGQTSTIYSRRTLRLHRTAAGVFMGIGVLIFAYAVWQSHISFALFWHTFQQVWLIELS